MTVYGYRAVYSSCGRVATTVFVLLRAARSIVGIGRK